MKKKILITSMIIVLGLFLSGCSSMKPKGAKELLITLYTPDGKKEEYVAEDCINLGERKIEIELKDGTIINYVGDYKMIAVYEKENK